MRNEIVHATSFPLSPEVKYFKRNYYVISVMIILVISSILRFYNYQNRWGLAYDQAHDALVARYALETHKIPLVGPFSSAGPFQTAGVWYWLIMIGTAFSPSHVIAPWVFFTILSIGYIGLLLYVGKKLVDEKFSLILGCVAGLSSAQIGQAVNLTNQAPLAIASLLAIWAMINYVRERSKKNLFFLGISVALAPTIHLQGVSLGLLLPITILFMRLPKIQHIPYLILGLLVPLLPLIIFDIKNSFVNFRNIAQYYFHDQYKISLDVLGRRWITYSLVFWPKSLSLIIGGNVFVGYLLAVLTGFVIGFDFLKKKFSKEWLIIIFSFLSIVILIRYVRTPLYDSYLVLLHTFIFLIISYALYFVIKRKRYVGLLLFLVVFLFTTQRTIAEVTYSKKNVTAEESLTIKKRLISLFPDQHFALFDFAYKTADKSLPLSLYLEADKKLDDSGKLIGITNIEMENSLIKKIITMPNGIIIYDLPVSSSAELIKQGWVSVNPSAVYKATEEWINK